LYHKGELLINKYVKKLDYVKMSVSVASQHNPLPHFYTTNSHNSLPLSTTTIGPVAMVRVKKTPLLTPTGPLF